MADDSRRRTPEEIAGWMNALQLRQDREAFAHLFEYFAPRVNAYLLRLGLNSMAAEELTQEVMLTLWLKADLFDAGKSSLSTWLFRIARNRRIDAARRERTAVIDENDPMLLPAEAALPDDVISATVRSAHLSDVLKELPSEQASLLRQAFFDGLTHSEIATATGLPLGTVKSRIRLAFGHLRQKLAQRGIDADA